MNLTVRQRYVLATIHWSTQWRGFSPTYTELMVALDVRSKNGVNDHLQTLIDKGLLTKTPLEARGLEVTTEGLRAIGYAENEDAVAKMSASDVRRLPVVDERDRLVGVLALDDVLELLAEEATSIGRLLRKRSQPV